MEKREQTKMEVTPRGGFMVVVDYGMGNLRSVENALSKLGYLVVVSKSPRLIKEAYGVILPGVGSFRDCMENLKKHHLLFPLREFIQTGRPFLGICLGMQVLFTESEEFGKSGGMNLIKGKVRQFSQNEPMKIPHMGWNTVQIKKKSPILRDLQEGTYFYFVHSFYCIPDNEEVITTTTDYGGEFASSIWKDNILACQFHPEKSQEVGLKVLRQFAQLCEKC